MEAEKSGGWDFLEWLGPDTSACIFSLLDDPADLARTAAVSHSWRRFVAANAFCKSLCLRICPEVATFVRAVEVVSGSPPVPAPAAHASGSSHDAESDHRIYSHLGGSLVSFKPSAGCVLHCIGASSTDRFPAERMENTVDPREMVGHRPSYWSSGGQYDPDVPESLSYWLQPRLFLVDEIRIRPYQVSFYYDRPICSSKMVRFQIGRSKLSYSSAEVINQSVIDDENYVWTYTSPEFPMAQLYYLEHLYDVVAPQNKYDIPRIKYFDKDNIKALTRPDRRKSHHVSEPFGHCDNHAPPVTSSLWSRR